MWFALMWLFPSQYLTLFSFYKYPQDTFVKYLFLHNLKSNKIFLLQSDHRQRQLSYTQSKYAQGSIYRYHWKEMRYRQEDVPFDHRYYSNIYGIRISLFIHFRDYVILPIAPTFKRYSLMLHSPLCRWRDVLWLQFLCCLS